MTLIYLVLVLVLSLFLLGITLNGPQWFTVLGRMLQFSVFALTLIQLLMYFGVIAGVPLTK